jgi:acetylornithine/succinyldiaminopimelate/putrescine aminotransferase/predicted amino acid dehydrogenase
MENIIGIHKPVGAPQESQEDSYRFYARPLTAKLLETMELSKHFIQGEGDYLYYSKNQKMVRVLDLTGGYGANILGHRHPRILSKLQEWKNNGAPSLTQGSQRKMAGLLAQKISETLKNETGEGPWITTLSNSGTEAIEAAYKHCLIYYKQKLIELGQEIEKEMNLALIKIDRTNESFRPQLIKKLRVELLQKIDSLSMNEERKSYFLHQLSHVHDIHELVSLVREINKKQLSLRPHFLSLEKGYHGKTMGALSLTYNEGFRDSFFLGSEHNEQTTFISQYIAIEKLNDLIASKQEDLLFLCDSKTGITWAKQSFSKIAGAFAEPIQGEAGIITVNDQFLAVLKKYSLQEDFLLIFDEIQSGLYRTGTMTAAVHSHITPDVFTFSKSLGGGIAKIAATTINARKYVEEFGFLHTSTFSDDDFSSSIALEVLEILQADEGPVHEGMRVSDYLWARLQTLKSQFPEIIKEVRGKGFMLAIEFHDELSKMGFEFKTICDSKMQGYMMASVLLNHENIRMSPSLSNNLTLRIQPSLYFTIIQTEELIRGLGNLCLALKNQDVSYFLSSIYPNQTIHNVKTPELKTTIEPGKRPLSVFLCHLIDESHVRKVTKSLKDVESHPLMKKLALTKDLAEFEIYHAQTIVDNNGKEMDIVMLAVPITSEELKKTFTSKQKFKVVQKVQNAVDFAKELGASTVGLGQFTSIVSGNGLYLNSHGMNLTTGNAFTISLTVEAALKSAEDKNIDLKKSTVALIGAAGNIMSVASSLMADHVGKVILIHHTPLESSAKFQLATRKILDDIKNSQSNSQVSLAVKKHWKNQDLLTFLSLPEISEVLVATSDMNVIKESDIVLCGASASNGFLSTDLFKEGAVVVDVAVPPSIKPEMLEKLKSERPDLTYHLGGVAQLPKNQSIDFFIFPLGDNECFACMAETFSIGFSGKRNFLNIGDLTKELVLEVQGLAGEAGFTLGSYKKKSSL